MPKSKNTGSPDHPVPRRATAANPADLPKTGRHRRPARAPLAKHSPSDQPHPRRRLAGQGRARKLLLKVTDVADELGIGRTKVFALLRDQELKSIKIGRCRRVTADALRDFIKGR